MVWVWCILSLLWVLGCSRSVGVPGGVSTIAAGLIFTSGLVCVCAVVGLWVRDWGLVPLPSIETEELDLVGIVTAYNCLLEIFNNFLVVVSENISLFWSSICVVLTSMSWDC